MNKSIYVVYFNTTLFHHSHIAGLYLSIYVPDESETLSNRTRYSNDTTVGNQSISSGK